MSDTTIVFVYNAEEGFFNALSDTVHKVFSPETYQCSLCRFTYGLTGMVLRWKKFIESLNERPVFLHRYEFKESYPDFQTELPVVFIEREGRQTVLLTAEQISECGDLEGLMQRLSERLAEETNNPVI
jgi:hypothetical protein